MISPEDMGHLVYPMRWKGNIPIVYVNWGGSTCFRLIHCQSIRVLELDADIILGNGQFRERFMMPNIKPGY
jgi:hypothetical protein